MVNRIQWLAQSFGISYKMLADFFRVSPELIQKVAQGKRKLHPSGQKFISDSLFSPYPIENEMANLPAPKWPDPEQEIRKKEMALRLYKVISEIQKQRTAFQNLTKRHQQCHAILFHTRQLPFTFEGTESLAEKWWIVAKAQAREALYSFTLTELRKKELKLALLLEEKKMLEKWLGEDERLELNQ